MKSTEKMKALLDCATEQSDRASKNRDRIPTMGESEGFEWYPKHVSAPRGNPKVHHRDFNGASLN